MSEDPTSDASRCNGLALRRAMRRVGQLYDSVLAPSGLRATQHSLLAQIARAGQPTLTALADSLVMDRSALGHTLKPLERDGLVALLPNPDDRRSRVVALTEAGRAKLVATKPLWAEAQARFEAIFGTAEAALLRATLSGIASEGFAKDFTGPSFPPRSPKGAGA